MRLWFAPLFLYVISCAQQQLIKDAALNQGRLLDIVDRASHASGLRVLTPLSVELVTRQQLHELLNQEAASEVLNDERALAETAMGLGSSQTEVGVDQLSRSVAGLYLPETRMFYLVSERRRGRDGSIHFRPFGELSSEVTLAHEVVHALQHQHFPHLFEPGAFPKRQSDAAVALRAAIEGTATLAAANTLGYMGGPRDPDEVISDSLREGPLDDEHPLARERTAFPYTYGYRIAYEDGKKLLESPPASTEQVIHPEGRGRRRPFLAFDFTSLKKDLQKHNCRKLSEDTMGELGISLWLRNIQSDIDVSAAEGWDGDRWIALQCVGGNEIAWLTSWDTQKDAIEFEEAIIAIADELQLRNELSPLLVSERDGREVVVTSSGLPIGSNRIHELAIRARVTTREELANHFRKVE
jgi:hypothetical protein